MACQSRKTRRNSLLGILAKAGKQYNEEGQMQHYTFKNSPITRNIRKLRYSFRDENFDEIYTIAAFS